MRQMGIGQLGGDELIFKRKFRWTFQFAACRGIVPEHFVKIAARPNLTIEETEINFLNAKAWIPGKAAWETITLTYIDVATGDNKPLWDWLASVYDFVHPISLGMGSNRQQYAGVGVLLLYDGCGNRLERWVLGDCWPQAINFGELDYSSSEEATIELTLRYSQVKYTSICPRYQPEGCCGPCTGRTGGGIGVPPSPFFDATPTQ